MRKAAALVAFVLLAALVAVWFLAVDAKPDSRASPAPVVATGTVADAGHAPAAGSKRRTDKRPRAQAGRDADPEPPESSPDTPDVPFAGTRIHVFRGDDVPVRGARVVRSAPPAGQPREVVTGADGIAKFEAPLANRETFEVAAAGMAKSLQEAEGQRSDVTLDVQLVPGADAKGTVVGAADGRPVAGAVVAALPVYFAGTPVTNSFAEATSADDGSFVLRGLPADAKFEDFHESVVLRVDAAGFAPVRIDALDIGAPPWTLRLDPSGRVRGTVRGPDGSVAANVTVTAEMALGSFHEPGNVVDPAPATTDADGRFEIAGMRLDWTYVLRARNAAGTASADVVGVVVQESDVRHERSVDVTLNATANVEIRVRGPNGEGIDDAAVLLCRTDEIIHEAKTAGGAARFSGIESGTWLVMVLASGFPAKTAALEEAEAGETQPVTVTLDRGWTLHARLVDDRGQPAKGEFTVHYDRTSGLRDFRKAEVKPGADGAFVFEGLGPEVEDLSVWRGRGQVQSVRLAGPVSEEMKIVVPRQAEVRFRVLPRTVTSVDWQTEVSGRRVDSGEADVPGGEARIATEPGTVLVLKAEGHPPVRREMDAGPGTTVDLGEIVIPDGLTLRGRVVDGAGRGVANASLWVWMAGGDLKSGEAGPDGTFAIAGMPEGDVSLDVDATGFLSISVTARAGGAEPLVVRVARGGLVRARAVGADGRDLAGVEIAAVDAEDDDAETNEGGKPLAVRLAPGHWKIVARRDGEDIASSEVDVAEGGEYDVVVRAAK